MSEPARVVVLAGNPNCGKTTLFNQLTGLRQRVGNYAGVTVEKKWGKAKLGDQEVTVVDLPGAYSLVSRSRDEAIAFSALAGHAEDLAPDLTVLVLDASNLDRNLYLALQVMELGGRVVVALNMMDLAAGMGLEVDAGKLEAALGAKVVPIVAAHGQGLDALSEAMRATLAAPAAPRRVPTVTRPELERVEAALPARGIAPERRASEASWVLSTLAASSDAETEGTHEDPFENRPDLRAARDAAKELLSAQPELPGELITRRYELATQLAEDATTRKPVVGPDWTTRVDRVLLHRVAGPLVLLLVTALVFQSIFAWAEPLMDLVEGVFGGLGDALRGVLPEGVLADLLVEGVVAGVGSVLVFLPQIGILFFFLALLEDSGYLARAAYMMDRLMAKVGLHGKAFVPLISGFACAIPAIMATRTIESWRDRVVTILVTPLMSCSARLPVYALIISALFASEDKVLGVLSVGAALLLSMYVLSVSFAVGFAALFKRTLLKSPTPPLVLELPPYRVPRLGAALRRMVERGTVFVRDAGTVILACSIILWALLSYPRLPELGAEVEARRVEIAFITEPEARAAAEAELQGVIDGERLRQSYGGRLGRLLEPLITPLGYDWKIGIGLIASFAAREVLVSTLGLVYGIGKGADEESAGLRDALRNEVDPRTGRKVYTPLVGLSLMIFFLLACQCMSTLAVVRRETNSWRWPAFMFAYMTVLAWVGAFVTYQGGRLLGFQ